MAQMNLKALRALEAQSVADPGATYTSPSVFDPAGILRGQIGGEIAGQNIGVGSSNVMGMTYTTSNKMPATSYNAASVANTK